MSSGDVIIKKGLQQIGAHSLAAPAPGEAIEDGKDALNSMLQLWISWGIKLPINPLNDPGDELNEPADTTNAIIFNLGIELAPFFDNGSAVIVSQNLKNSARKGLSQVKQVYRVLVVPPRRISSTTPRGIGNYDGTNSRTFFGRGEPLSG